jgi:hypothetical protein
LRKKVVVVIGRLGVSGVGEAAFNGDGEEKSACLDFDFGQARGARPH